ncbi:predicted protein [Plenodomus lingam JN3]|uniref:Uncharacterized protein n=1 Tax=Leptosphaeria maculans (strain JN3 / isolate v23.1.3 / race Av1-4-5-6-7-8) TaxID=985895 RepID=E4ZG42_LEPMJ|nr:predicted protein [Plenodomus lingam JN3]CBX90262.1 predicted protein [Plenodomus lingam JN3]
MDFFRPPFAATMGKGGCRLSKRPRIACGHSHGAGANCRNSVTGNMGKSSPDGNVIQVTLPATLHMVTLDGGNHSISSIHLLFLTLSDILLTFGLCGSTVPVGGWLLLVLFGLWLWLWLWLWLSRPRTTNRQIRQTCARMADEILQITGPYDTSTVVPTTM